MIGLSLLLVTVVGGVWICRTSDATRRSVLLGAVIALLCPLLFVTFAIAESESVTSVRQDGALVVPTAGDAVVIGSACPTASISVPGTARFVDAGWCATVQLRGGDSTLVLTPTDGVDAVVRVVGGPWWNKPPRTEVLAGHEMTYRSEPRSLSGRALVFRRVGSRGTLAWGNSESLLSDAKDVVDNQLSASLRRGAQLCELQWTADVPPCGSASVVLLNDGRSLMGTTLPLPPPLGTRLLLSIADSSTRGSAIAVSDGDTIRVYASGNAYEFSLSGVAPNPYAPHVRGVAARTVASWRRSRLPLVGSETPVAGRRLPSPTRQFLFGERIGLASSMSSFLGRVSPTEAGARLVVGGRVYPLASSGTVVPVRSNDAQVGAEAYLVSAQRSQAASSSSTLLEGALLIGLTIVVGLIVLPRGTSVDVPVALVVLGALTIASWRDGLASRLASFAPFVERATDRGSTLWTGVLMLMLLLSQLHQLGGRFHTVRLQLLRLGVVPARETSLADVKWPLIAVVPLLMALLYVSPTATGLGIGVAGLLLLVLMLSSSMLTSTDIAQNGWRALLLGGGTAALWLTASRLPLQVGGFALAGAVVTSVAAMSNRYRWMRGLRLPFLSTLAVGLVSFRWPEAGTSLSFALSIAMLLMSLHTGRVADAMSNQQTLAATTAGRSSISPRFHHLAPFVIVMIALAAIAVVDVGGAVMGAPAFFVGGLIAVNVRRASRTVQLALGSLVCALVFVALSVLRPSAEGLADEQRPISDRVQEFNNAGGVIADGLRHAGLATSVDRSVVRWLAAHDPVGLEAVSPFVDASTAAASIAQTLAHVAAMKECSRNASFMGAGFGSGTAIAAGISPGVLGAESAYSGLVLEEFGLAGGASVLLGYALVAIGAVWALVRRGRAAVPGVDTRLRAALLVASSLWMVFQAAWVAASNLGVVTLTGANMPGLAAFSAADALFGTALLVFIIMPVINMCAE